MDPSAVQLRRIWKTPPNGPINGWAGHGAGGIGKGPNGLAAWAVHTAFSSDSIQWCVYYGSSDTLSTVPAWRYSSSTFGDLPPYPTVGRFWGDGREAVGFPNYEAFDIGGGGSVIHLKYTIFRKDSNNVLESAPAAIVDPNKNSPVEILVQPTEILAADLDGDGADELVLVINTMVGATGISNYPEVWIYRGGPNFSTDAPTLIIRDAQTVHPSSQFYAKIGDIDGDHRPDLAISGFYDVQSTQNVYTKIFFSSPGSPWNWKNPDRVLRSIPSQPLPDYRISLHDVNGDGTADVVGLVDGHYDGIYLWMSGMGHDARTRPFDSTDYDIHLKTTMYVNDDHMAGSLNDTSGRYEMLPILVSDNGLIHLLSGGPNGTDGRIVATIADTSLIPDYVRGPIGDVNGDGWEDYMVVYLGRSEPQRSVMIFAGGAYIPHKLLTGSVKVVPIEGHAAGLFVYPCPAKDQVKIAWRGDLERMPERFEVRDLLGCLVASGEVEPYRGAALWECKDAPTGIYMLNVFDRNGGSIATASIVKE
jgi:hypothetical protein